MKEKIYSIIAEHYPDFEASMINDSTDLINEMKFDSLLTIKLLIAIEEEFGIEIDFDDFDFEMLYKAGDFADYIMAKV